jgi:hypothetical protein
LFAINSIKSDFADLGPAQVMIADGYRWPTFLLKENLVNVVNQIAVIAIVAIGMTMVITGGIDLSVGSDRARSGVATTLMVQMGGVHAGALAMIGASLLAIFACGLIGAMCGVMITRFNILLLLQRWAGCWLRAVWPSSSRAANRFTKFQIPLSGWAAAQIYFPCRTQWC